MGLEEDLLKVNENIRKNSGKFITNRNLERLRYNVSFDAISYLEGLLNFEDIHNILEVGCGKGIAINELAKKNKNKTFYGIDICLDKFQIEKNRKNVKLKLNDAHHLDFPDNSMDLIYSFMTFPYILDKLKALREIYRVLKPNGIAIIDSPPEYFYPYGKEIIPYNNNESDIFWSDFSDDFILINKKGKNSECLNKNYLDFSYLSWDKHYFYPILSIYKSLPRSLFLNKWID
jgi:SAM-dependent methyltransferase